MPTPSPVQKPRRPRMPAEWEPQEAVWLSWPVNESLWPGRRGEIEGTFARLAALLAASVEVRINAVGEAHARIRGCLDAAGADPRAVVLYPHPTNDVWCRDHGPTFVLEDAGARLAAIDWTFNAWGGKFLPWNNDDAVAARMAAAAGADRRRRRLVCEGGAIEVDGQGRLLTTASVLLNANRNPGWSRAAVEEELRSSLGAEEITWLPGGLVGDDTDGHIDTLARFMAPGVTLAASPAEGGDPADHAVLAKNRRLLLDAGLEVVDLPQPAPVAGPAGWREAHLPATYANFFVTNGAVVLPTYGQAEADDRAAGVVADCFPGRQVVGFDCRGFLIEGGAVHCLTQQQPATA